MGKYSGLQEIEVGVFRIDIVEGGSEVWKGYIKRLEVTWHPSFENLDNH